MLWIFSTSGAAPYKTQPLQKCRGFVVSGTSTFCPQPETRGSELARDEAVTPFGDPLVKLNGGLIQTQTTKQPQPNSTFLPMILTHNGNRSARLPLLHCLHDLRSISDVAPLLITNSTGGHPLCFSLLAPSHPLCLPMLLDSSFAPA